LQSLEVSLIIPAKNEVETISGVIQEAKKHAPHPLQIIVVDGGSNDGTDQISGREGAEVLVEVRPGYGRAIRSGLEHGKGDVLIIMDGDGTYEASDMSELIEPLVEGKADIVLASRYAGSLLPGSMHPLNNVGNIVITWLYNRLYSQRLTDSQTGFRALTRKAFEAMTFKEEDMAFSTEMLTQAARCVLRIAEVPSTYKPRDKRSKSKMKRARTGWKVLRVLTSK
jgi:glycosyltransferase involved in cell wall biosynthesis